MAGEHGPEKAANHDEGPDCAGDEGCLLLLIVGLGRLLLPVSHRISQPCFEPGTDLFLDSRAIPGRTSGLRVSFAELRHGHSPALAAAVAPAVLKLDVPPRLRHGRGRVAGALDATNLPRLFRGRFPKYICPESSLRGWYEVGAVVNVFAARRARCRGAERRGRLRQGRGESAARVDQDKVWARREGEGWKCF